MRNDDSRIIRWLEDIVKPIDNSASASLGKRKRSSANPQIPSPPASGDSFHDYEENKMPERDTSPKRRKAATGAIAVGDDPFDNQRTPRAPVSLRDQPDASYSNMSSSASTTESGRSSPSKSFSRFPFLSLDPSGIERAAINLGDAEGLPEAAQALVVDIEGIASGEGVVPRGLKDEIGEKKKKASLLYARFRDFVYAPDALDSLPQRWLLEDVLEIVNVAQDCQETEQDESGWNNLVHSPLLTMALARPLKQLVGYTPW